MDISDFISLLRNADRKKHEKVTELEMVPIGTKFSDTLVSCEASPILSIVNKPKASDNLSTIVDKKPTHETAPAPEGDWMKSDAFGTLLGDDREEKFERNVKRIYGTKGR